jgi:hypothetical protein
VIQRFRRAVEADAIQVTDHRRQHAATLSMRSSHDVTVQTGTVDAQLPVLDLRMAATVSRASGPLYRFR